MSAYMVSNSMKLNKNKKRKKNKVAHGVVGREGLQQTFETNGV